MLFTSVREWTTPPPPRDTCCIADSVLDHQRLGCRYGTWSGCMNFLNEVTTQGGRVSRKTQRPRFLNQGESLVMWRSTVVNGLERDGCRQVLLQKTHCKLQELTHEMVMYQWNVLGLCEMRWKTLEKPWLRKDTRSTSVPETTCTNKVSDF